MRKTFRSTKHFLLLVLVVTTTTTSLRLVTPLYLLTTTMPCSANFVLFCPTINFARSFLMSMMLRLVTTVHLVKRRFLVTTTALCSANFSRLFSLFIFFLLFFCFSPSSRLDGGSWHILECNGKMCVTGRKNRRKRKRTSVLVWMRRKN